MQHLLDENEYQELLRNKRVSEIALKNEEALTEYFNIHCARLKNEYCDKCPIRGTTYSSGKFFVCAAGKAMHFSK